MSEFEILFEVVSEYKEDIDNILKTGQLITESDQFLCQSYHRYLELEHESLQDMVSSNRKVSTQLQNMLTLTNHNTISRSSYLL